MTLKELGVPGGAGMIEPLKVSYRSTAEITSFARGVLGPLAHEAEPIATRHGPPVELFSFASAGEAVAFLADALRELASNEPDANVALLSRFPQQAEVYYEGPRARRGAERAPRPQAGLHLGARLRRHRRSPDEGPRVRRGHPARDHGVELRRDPQARHALYVGATRAAHQLWCIASEAPSKRRDRARDADGPRSTAEARVLLGAVAKKIAVVGAGAWGTALAAHAARLDHEVKLWAREPDVVRDVNERSENRLVPRGRRAAEDAPCVGEPRRGARGRRDRDPRAAVRVPAKRRGRRRRARPEVGADRHRGEGHR